MMLDTMSSLIGSTIYGAKVMDYDHQQAAYRLSNGMTVPDEQLRNVARDALLYNGESTVQPKDRQEALLHEFLKAKHDATKPKSPCTDKVQINIPKRGTTMDAIKSYLNKYNTVIFTILFVALVDHFMFKGALRERIKGLLGGMLNKAETESAAS